MSRECPAEFRRHLERSPASLGRWAEFRRRAEFRRCSRVGQSSGVPRAPGGASVVFRRCSGGVPAVFRRWSRRSPKVALSPNSRLTRISSVDSDRTSVSLPPTPKFFVRGVHMTSVPSFAAVMLRLSFQSAAKNEALSSEETLSRIRPEKKDTGGVDTCGKKKEVRSQDKGRRSSQAFPRRRRRRMEQARKLFHE
ncbi:hypothetical protein IEQ34_008126 [Dendrobium chrysotoxum]|uniref:Uncharacterized protein n=1 Tax=Dendrobium chrysotoxum TaxID=161865 RepID=A0AAV7GPK0_DENCH|nr:hypothetical protein IEQ34_008126 [Dendrobium chrysotoxum]